MRTIKQTCLSIGVAILLLSPLLLLVPSFSGAQVNYPSSSNLGSETVRSSHIQNGTIVNTDVNSDAAIDATKLRFGAGTGQILMSDGTKAATSSNLKYATSSNDLYVLGGRVHASSTNFGGVNYTWPSADGTNGQAIKTNGSGTLSFGNVSASAVSTDFTAGQPISAGDALFVAPSLTYSQAFTTCIGNGNDEGFGKATGDVGAAQSVTVTTSYYFNAVSVRLKKVGSPSDNLNVEIRADNAGTPSNTVYATSTIAGSELSTSYVQYDLAITPGMVATSSTKIWITFLRDGANSDVNYYVVDYHNAAACSTGNAAWYNGTSWSNQAAVSIAPNIALKMQGGAVYKTSTEFSTTTNSFIGFAAAAAASSSVFAVNVDGIATGLSGLTTGSRYWISTSSAAISTNASTLRRQGCIALSSTTCLVTNIW